MVKCQMCERGYDGLTAASQKFCNPCLTHCAVPYFREEPRSRAEIMQAAGLLTAPDISTVGPPRVPVIVPYTGWRHTASVDFYNEYRWGWTIVSEYVVEGRTVRISRVASHGCIYTEMSARQALEIALDCISESRKGTIVR